MNDFKVRIAVRTSGALLLALMINVLLFAMMQQMVTGRRIELNDITDAQIIDFNGSPGRLETEPQRRLHKKAPEPTESPEPPSKQILAQMEVVQKPVSNPLARLKIDAPLATIDSDGPYLGSISSQVPGFIMAHELISVLRRSPPYPRLLQRRGIEGYVLVEFTVTEKGLVQDPVIIESRPHEDFGESVLKTVRHWKFQPYLIDCKPVAVRVRQGVDFTME